RVGHAAHGGEPAGRRRARPAGDRLLVLVARLAQVHVHVDEAGTDDLARGVDAFGPCRRPERAADLRDAAVGDEHVLHGVDAAGGIEDAAPGDQEAHAAALLPVSRYSTAIRTATPFATWSRITE